jgi:hypothetical protein
MTLWISKRAAITLAVLFAIPISAAEVGAASANKRPATPAHMKQQNAMSAMHHGGMTGPAERVAMMPSSLQIDYVRVRSVPELGQ